MDDIMEKNLRTFANGFMQQQSEYANVLQRVKELEKENKKLKETIKDHQLYEEKLEHRIIEFEELLHGE